ncbi:dTDP-4-dehydrorhamnose reductase [Halotalea alkalilenta]|uniref:dTDP-4-dehydrorhamnose reductase n=1 Tax=Halotalea alkalilenta TaxID=376489 RepID=UPI000693B04D|nr:dTDP-4-dehydrorhamnose reductase [Halotalea alkalilenta]
MKVLVTGAQGQVGKELIKAVPIGWSVIGLGSSQLDITQPAAVANAVAEFQPELIVNAAAYTAVDKAESDVDRAYEVNRDGPANLGKAAAVFGIPVLHISTDYVFNGTLDRPYREEDSVGPTGIYGESKLAGEQYLLESNSSSFILRTSWVFSEHGNNFVKTMLKLGVERNELGVVADQRGAPTSAASIAAVLWKIAERISRQETVPWGIYHFSNTPYCTWFDFANEIFDEAVRLNLLDKKPIINALSTADYPTPARRPAFSMLDNRKLLELLPDSNVDYREELSKVILAISDKMIIK